MYNLGDAKRKSDKNETTIKIWSGGGAIGENCNEILHASK